MNKIWLIIQREYITRVRKKSFILTTILAPVGFAVLIFAAPILAQFSGGSKKLAVIDKSGLFAGKLKDAEDGSLYFSFVDTPLLYIDTAYERMGYSGILLIPELGNLQNPRGIDYRSEKPLSLKTKLFIRDELEDALRQIKAERSGVDKDLLRSLEEIDVKIESTLIGESAGEQGDTEISTALGYFMGFTMYMVLFIYGSMVMKGVIEEKTNRIVEVIISSVKPFQLMMGKVLGVGAVGITQFFIWGVLINLIIFIGGLLNLMSAESLQSIGNSPDAAEVAQMQGVIQRLFDLNLLALFGYFIFFFFGGYLLYGALFAALGSAVNDDGEGQSLSIIVSLPIITSIILLTAVIQDPDSQLAVWSSIIPFSSPIIMLARIPFGPPVWQIILSMLMLVLGFIGTIWLAGKIYRVGILMRGKKPTLSEVYRWIRFEG